MWDVLPTIDVNRPQAAEHKWSVYFIRLEGIRDDQMKREQNVGRAQSKQIRQADQGIHVGSAQAQHSRNAWAGEALRLFKGHEEIFNLAPQGLRALRMQHKDPHVMYVHRVAMRTGAARMDIFRMRSYRENADNVGDNCLGMSSSWQRL